jgi:putative ABC transport system substrate-binding protein
MVAFIAIGLSVRPEASMQRREFITLLGTGGAAATQAALPRLARAEISTNRPLLAIFGGVTRKEFPASFMEGMRDLGYIEGGNIDVEYRFANGHLELLPSLARELIHLAPKVIVAGLTPAAIAATT